MGDDYSKPCAELAGIGPASLAHAGEPATYDPRAGVRGPCLGLRT
jgi:hypothetical protein